ncbi:MAG: sugar kinase [Anaerolineae bacterium]|nr:sugar kinase [Anaerolineae bacterium]
MQVACLGIMVADVVARPVVELPERGRLTLVDKMELHTGGCATNTGISLAKLGMDVGVLGAVGEDGFGEFIVHELNRHRVDSRGVRRKSDANTSATMAMVEPDGERRFLHYLGANGKLVQADVDMEIVAEAEILHIAGALVMPGIDGEPTAAILRQAKDLGLTTSFDTVWDARGRWMEMVEPCLPFIDVMLPSLAEAQMITGKDRPEDVARVFIDHGVGIVGLKMGEQGSYVRTEDVELRLPPYVVEAVDATGAGDAFVAGFLAGLLQGWDLERTGRLANAVGALCVTAMGAVTGVRSLEETLRFMEVTPTRAG